MEITQWPLMPSRVSWPHFHLTALSRSLSLIPARFTYGFTTTRELSKFPPCYLGMASIHRLPVAAARVIELSFGSAYGLVVMASLKRTDG